MECDRAREAISARIDREDPGVPEGALEAHLAGCEACRSWQQRAHVLTRRARLGGPFLDRDLAGQVLAAIPPAPDRRRLRLAVRAVLLVVALGQLAITVPLLVLGHDHDAGTHAAHELGSFDLALAIAFAVGAIRPALSAGLAWPCGIAAGGLVSTAIADLIGGQTIGADEAQHLVAAVGAALLLWQARTGASRAAVAVGATDWPQAVSLSSAAGASSRLDGPPRSPSDGAARLDAPGTAQVARAGGPPEVAAQAGTARDSARDSARASATGGPDGARLPRPGRDGDGKEAVA